MTYPKQTFIDIFYRRRFVIALILSAIILFMNSCVKDIIENKAENYFEDNYLNSDFVIELATKDGTDLTAQYQGYTFKLLKNTLLEGPATAAKNGTNYTGTWATNDDYSKLTISITQPTMPAEFAFLNRDWKFTNKYLPVLKFAPWGTTEAVVLHLRKL